MVGDALRVEMPRRFDVCVFDPQELHRFLSILLRPYFYWNLFEAKD